jgi:hypothetical protein
MSENLFPPAAPGDPQRPASSVDLDSDALALATWCDYAATLQAQVVARRRNAHALWIDDAPPPMPTIAVPGACPFCARPRKAGVAHRPLGQDADGMSLAQAMRVRRVSRYALSERTGLGFGTICAVVRGDQSPQRESREKIAAALGFDPDTIAWPEQHQYEYETEVA